MKVLKNDKENYKLKKALVYCNGYLTMLRAEERRRVFKLINYLVIVMMIAVFISY